MLEVIMQDHWLTLDVKLTRIHDAVVGTHATEQKGGQWKNSTA
jgi:hypothetical protein